MSSIEWRLQPLESVRDANTKRWKDIRIYTIGHSTRTLDELVSLLRASGVSVLADIRTIPRSRHNPQFNGDAFRPALRSQGIRYIQLPELGGLRRARKDSRNTAWRNASFRGYADYMLTTDFETGLHELHDLAAEGTVALMCAEAVPWRCHRSLVADALTARGAHVAHITSAKRAATHRMTPFAVVKGTTVTYPGEDAAGVPLATPGPFHLEATVRVLQRRPSNRVDVWQHDHYLRVLETSEGLALVEVANHGTIDAPDVRFIVRRGNVSAAARDRLALTLRTMLGLDVDPEPLQVLAEAEPRLRGTALALRGMRPPRFAELFEAFANVVPFQQISLDAGVAIVGRMVERLGESLEHDGRRFYAFPTAQVVAKSGLDALRTCGLSLRKAETLRQVAIAIASGEIDAEELSRLPSNEALRELRQLKGIGPWSASLVLLRGMGRLDVFPPGDVGAARGLSTLMGVEPGPSLDRIIRRFGDQCGYLYFCALGGSLLAKDLIRAAPMATPSRQSKRRRAKRQPR
jgi:3-methyladenine DNA glycosylase/8-oxoguanine DNA glycosylase